MILLTITTVERVTVLVVAVSENKNVVGNVKIILAYMLLLGGPG
jgi:hypothetical protein